MKTNEELQKEVQDAIKWEPLLHAAEIGVIAKNGVITLTGDVNSYGKKLEAEDAAKSVAGVKVIVDKIEIKYISGWGEKDDNEMASEILKAAKYDWRIPKDKIKAIIEDGWVTLEGEVQWNYQKEAVKDIVKNHLGVKGVTDNITIKETEDQIEKKAIERALRRNWFIDDKNITVNVSGHKVTLTGSVNSWNQFDKAARLVWNAPGVRKLDNQLHVDYD